MAEQLSQPFSLAFALGMTSVFHLIRRDYPNAQAFSEAVIALSREQGFASFVATGDIGLRLSRAMQGIGEEDLTEIYQAIATRRAAGMEVLGTSFLLCLAETYLHAGHGEAGRRVLSEIRAMMDAKAEYIFEAEWYRLRGEFRLQQTIPDEAQATADFQQAIESSRRCHAKWWELRAAVSLANIWLATGQVDGGVRASWRHLRPIYRRLRYGGSTTST